MDPLTTFETLETLYARVLELTRDQERCLRAGDLAELRALLGAKDATLAEAQGLLARFKAAGGDASAPAVQAILGRVGGLLRDLVAAEERCRALAPSGPAAPSRQQVAAAYGGSRR